MNQKNDYIREYLGVDKFHARGYTGSRVKALTGERIEGAATEHAMQTAAAFREIAPDAVLSYATHPTDPDAIEKFHRLRGDACVMFTSLSASGCSYQDEIDAAIPERLFVCVAAGNDDDDSANAWMRPASVYGVGAVDVVYSAMRNGEPAPGATLLVQAATYTSQSERVDFGAATGLYLDGYLGRFPGTSCAAPVLAGMAALVNDFFIHRTGRPLPHLSMLRFLKDHAEDIESAGKDELTGWGIPRLPDPESIDVWMYQVPEEPEEEAGAGGPSSAPSEHFPPGEGIEKEEKRMKILLIAGHGAGDTGAVAVHGTRTYRECDETRKLMAALVTKFAKAGVDATAYSILRNAFADYKEGALASRARFSDYDAVLELHFNAFRNDAGDGKVKGVEAYVTTAAKETGMAEAVCKAVAALGFTNRGVKRQNYAVIGQAGIAGAEAVLLEVCFLDDADDMALYEASRDKVAQAICDGVCEGLGVTADNAAAKTAREIVMEKAGLEEKTMDYLAAYKWGKELLEKLAKAMN